MRPKPLMLPGVPTIKSGDNRAQIANRNRCAPVVRADAVEIIPLDGWTFPQAQPASAAAAVRMNSEASAGMKIDGFMVSFGQAAYASGRPDATHRARIR